MYLYTCTYILTYYNVIINSEITIFVNLLDCSYADDITLSCPSICGLTRIDICNKLAADHYLIFNSNKMYARRTRIFFQIKNAIQ